MVVLGPPFPKPARRWPEGWSGILRRMETFVVRAWRPRADEALPHDDDDRSLRGVVEHVATGASIPFRDADQLVAFLLGGDEGDSDVSGGHMAG